MAKPEKKSKLKLSFTIISIIIVGLALGVMLLLSMHPMHRKPKLFEISAADTVSLAREFYACGNDCPYYRVLASENEEKYIGQMADIQGVNVWADYDKIRDIESEQAQAIYFAITNPDIS